MSAKPIISDRPIVQYQARRLRSTASRGRGQRRKARGQVVGAFRLPVINHKDYSRIGEEGFTHPDALKTANALNALNNLPIYLV